jgi:hypothetical protein
VYLTAVSVAASALLTPGLVLAFGAAGGAIALVLVEAIGLTAGLVALIPFLRLPFGTGAMKIAAAALGAGVAAMPLPAGGGWRLAVALAVYGGGVLALRPWPASRWRRVARAMVG